MDGRDWHPDRTRSLYGRRPVVGDLLGMQHAVWRVTGVDDEPLLEDDDRQVWLDHGMPDLATWNRRPYRVRAVHVGGVIPGWVNDRPDREGVIRVRARHRVSWQVYKSGRWPQCSCCGEPMPCRAELEDRAVDAAEKRMTVMERRMPGCCWACDEPITNRQRAVTYLGTNLDLPTAPPPRFHRRRKCQHAAEAYEERWLAADPARGRILTWPLCPGTLVVHHDGDSECHGGLDTCHGHETHNHRHRTSCYALSHGCGRECPTEGHPGCRPRARADRMSPELSRKGGV